MACQALLVNVARHGVSCIWLMLNTICKNLCEEAFIEVIIDEELEVKVGFKIGTGCQNKQT